MDIRDAFITHLKTSAMVCGMYLEDLTDEESMQRPHPQCNHINWQIGHLIASEHSMASACGEGIPDLPDGFAEKYAKGTGINDDPNDFIVKSELMKIAAKQHEAVLNLVQGMSDEDFDKPGPESMKAYAPTLGALVNMMGSHWMMHAGQWVVLRRQLGRDVMI